MLLVTFDLEARALALLLLTKLRSQDIAAEVYPDLSKVKKMLDFANAKAIP